MKAIVLTSNEKEVLAAIVANARKVGDSGVEFILEDVAKDLNRSIRSVTGTVANLQKKGLVSCANGESYFDGEVTEEGFKVVEERKEEEFNSPVMDERIVYMNEIAATKLSSVSKSKREDIKEAKAIIKHIFENWDNAEINGGLKTLIDDYEVKVSQYKLWCIAKSRYDQLVYKTFAEIKENMKYEEPEFLKKLKELKSKNSDAVLLMRCGDFYEAYEEDADVVAKVIDIAISEEDGVKVIGFPYHALDIYLPKIIRAGHRIVICDDIKKEKTTETMSETAIASPETPKTKKDTSKKSKGVSKKKYNVGDHHPNHPDWIYTEYKPGKFDWRADKSVSKVKTDKKAEEISKPKKEEMKVAFDKEMNVDEFIVALRGKNLSAAQKSYLKLLKKGYRISGDKRFFELENSERKACNWESIQAMIAKVGITEIPTGLVK